MESGSTEGDRPVGEIPMNSTELPSSTGHVKPRVNPARPRAKAKYCR